MTEHQSYQKLCPFLPKVVAPLRAVEMKRLGSDRGPGFYFRALECAQSLWLQALPAQSLLLINRALGSDLNGDEEVLEDFPIPYEAAAWVMQNRKKDQFIGNPRRHYQHLATRMVEPRKELRTWRAWGCWYLACSVFSDYPADEVQLQNESVTEPTREETFSRLEKLGIKGEANLWNRVANIYSSNSSSSDRC